LEPFTANRLMNLLRESTTIEGSNYGSAEPDYLSNVRVILSPEGQGVVLEYFDGARDRVANVLFQKKDLDLRTFKK